MTTRTDLSSRTWKAYSREIKKFQEYFQKFAGINPEEAEENLIEQYLERCYPRYISSPATLKLHMAAIKFWYFEEKGKKYDRNIPGPVSTSETPRVLEQEELSRLFQYTRGHTCGLMIRLIFAAGIRLREITRIRVEDLDFGNMLIRMRDEKDESSHSTILPEAMKYDLMRETQNKVPSDYLFSLRKYKSGRSVPVSRRTLQHYLTKAAEDLGLGRITVQTLRDNFAIYLLRRGLDPRILAGLMGFKNFRSILRYTRIVNESEVKIVSPLTFY